MIMQSTESFTEEKEKYTPWGWEVTESVKAEKDTLCRKFLLLLPTHKSLSLAGALRGWRLREARDPAPLGKRAGVPCSLLCCISPAPVDHCQRDLIVSLTPLPRLLPRSGSESQRTRNVGAPRWASISCSSQTPHGALDPHAPRACWPARYPTSQSQAAWPQSAVSLGHPSLRPCRGTPAPHLSAGQAKPPDLLRGSGLRQPPPGHPPRAGGGYGGVGGCDPNGPLHAPGRAAGGRGASHAGAGAQGRAGGRLARGPGSPRTKPREPGTRDSGEGSWRGGATGVRPRGRAPPRQGARARAQPGGRGASEEHARSGWGEPAAEAAAPDAPRPRRVRAQPAKSAAGGWAVPICGGGTLWAGPSPGSLPARSTRKPPREVEQSPCSGLGQVRMSCPSSSQRFPSCLHSLSLPSLPRERRHFWPVYTFPRFPAPAPPLTPLPKFSAKTQSSSPRLGLAWDLP